MNRTVLEIIEGVPFSGKVGRKKEWPVRGHQAEGRWAHRDRPAVQLPDGFHSGLTTLLLNPFGGTVLKVFSVNLPFAPGVEDPLKDCLGIPGSGLPPRREEMFLQLNEKFPLPGNGKKWLIGLRCGVVKGKLGNIKPRKSQSRSRKRKEKQYSSGNGQRKSGIFFSHGAPLFVLPEIALWLYFSTENAERNGLMPTRQTR